MLRDELLCSYKPASNKLSAEGKIDLLIIIYTIHL